MFGTSTSSAASRNRSTCRSHHPLHREASAEICHPIGVAENLGRKWWKTKQSSPSDFSCRFFLVLIQSGFVEEEPFALHVWVAARDEDFVGQHHHWTPFWFKSCNQNTFKFTKSFHACHSWNFEPFQIWVNCKGVSIRFKASGCIPRPNLAQPCTVPLPRYCEAKDASTSSCHSWKLKADDVKLMYLMFTKLWG